MKPHKKWDCPCTDCQKWYRDEVKRLKEALESLLSDPFVLRDHDFDCNGKTPLELIVMGADAALKQVSAIARAVLGEGEETK